MSSFERTLNVALLPGDADLKIDPAALTTMSMEGFPVYMPDGEFLSPGVIDALESSDDQGEWHPNSKRTRLLLACVHATKDIATHARGIDRENPWKERRPIALLATPLVSLCDRTSELCKSLGPEKGERAHWPREDNDLLVEAGRRLRKQIQGPLRTLRHERTAHHDLDVLRPNAVRIKSLGDLLLPPFADALTLLLLCFNYRRVYTWSRIPIGAAPDEVEIMTEYPIAIRVHVDKGGTIRAIGSRSTVAADPRGPLRETVMNLFEFYNLLALSTTPQHPTIVFREHENDE